MIRTVPNLMERYGCSAETAQRYMDLREEGYQQHEALLMAGLSDPPDPSPIQFAGDEPEAWQPMESAPKQPGRYIYVQQTAVYRWLPYKANSHEFKRGKKGRWQKHTGYGFDNAELEGIGWRDIEGEQP